MAKEKFITGKVDDAHHAGRASEVRRIQEAENQVQEYMQTPFPTSGEIYPLETAQPERRNTIMNGE